MWPEVLLQPFAHFMEGSGSQTQDPFGSPRGQNYLLNKTNKVLLAFFTLNLLQVHSGVFQMLSDL